MAKWKMHEFFAGCGLAGYGLREWFDVAWANDIDERKAVVYRANFNPEVFRLENVKSVHGSELPEAHLSWASFPCQDLSLAGKMQGLDSSRSGLVWEWFRILDEMPVKPKVLALENVMGYVSADKGKACKAVHHQLLERGYRSGAVVLDAALFLPQSRKRVFVIALKDGVDVPKDIVGYAPCWLHPSSLASLGQELDGWIWWNAPKPCNTVPSLAEIADASLPCNKDAILDILQERHRLRIKEGADGVFAAYQRTRNGRQVLEARFDGLAGCLRTLAGGCNRQYLIVKNGNGIHCRLLSLQEAARLMGAPDGFAFPCGCNAGFNAMGDAVAVPAVEFVGKRFLSVLADSAYKEDRQDER